MKVFASVAVLALAGCANTYNIRSHQAVDLSDKTITVPIGGSGLIGRLKDALAADGWKLSVRRGPKVIEGTVGEKTRLEQYNTFNARYELLVRWEQFDWCVVSASPAIHFDISMVDNKTGDEALTMSGTGCESIAAQKFVGAIRGTNE